VTHKEHQRQLKRIHQQIASGLHEAKLPDRQRREYQAAIQDIVGRLGPRAVERLHRFAGGYKFYQSHRALTQGIKGKYANLKILLGEARPAMSGSEQADRAKALKKLRQFRKRWAGHTGADTVYGHILIGSKDNGAIKRRKKGVPQKRAKGGAAGD